MDKKDKLIEYWQKASELDFDAAHQLMQSKKFPHALFFGHLSLEKMLKALYVEVLEEYPPKTHNLLILINDLNITVPHDIEKDLIEINSFNIEARYPDEKFKFYDKCTPEFSRKYFKRIEEINQWLKKKF